MDRTSRQRRFYVTARQKKKLLEYMTKYPYLRTGRLSQNFTANDSQKLWVTISNECNAIPGGSRKTWRQWRKTWQDMKSKYKKRHAESKGDYSPSIVLLTQAEQEALGLTEMSCKETTEFVNSGTLEQDNAEESFNNEDESNTSYFDGLETAPEEKVFVQPLDDSISDTSNHKDSVQTDKHSNSCVFNCNVLARQEQKKIDMKQDYINYKKEYLKQKLKLLKEQTDALKCIAKELGSK